MDTCKKIVEFVRKKIYLICNGRNDADGKGEDEGKGTSQ